LGEFTFISKITLPSTQHFWATFSAVINYDKNVLGYILVANFSQTHLVTLLPFQGYQRQLVFESDHSAQSHLIYSFVSIQKS
jgi:hypothetical protein